MYILFDIGGTKMRFAASEDGQVISEPIVHETPKYAKDGFQLIDKIMDGLTKGKTVNAICGSIAGVIDRQTGTVVRSPNLRGWEQSSLKDYFIKFSSKVFIENDAALAGLAEACLGAGKDFEIVAYLTVSTGIGGARIFKKNIDARRVSFEPGQQIIDTENVTSLENRVSGRALEKKYRKEPKDITDEAVWKRAADDLAVGLHNTILHWSPDVVVLGGPMVLKKPGIDIEEVKQHLARIMYIFPALPEIRLSELGDSVGLYGALQHIHHNENADN